MAKTKRGFMDVYKHYDTSEGLGSAADWRAAFNARMGLDKAREVLGNQDPFFVLGVASNSTWEAVKKAYREMVMKYHPDRNPGDDEAVATFKRKQAAYEVLEHRFKK